MRSMCSIRPLAGLLSALAVLVPASPVSAAPDPYLLVSTDSSIWKFDLEGHALGRLVNPGDPGEGRPQHMSVGPDGNLYVANWDGGIEVYDLDSGDHVRTVQTGSEMVNPAFLTIRDSTLIVGSFGTDRVLRYDLGDHDAPMSDLIPKSGAFFQDPHHILWLDNGDMLVSMATQVSRFAADGSYLGAFTTTNIATATGKAIVGDTLVVNNYYGSTQQYDLASGAYLGQFNLDGIGPGGDGLLTMADGSVLISDNLGPYVRWYDADGNFLKVFASKVELNFEHPNGMLLVTPVPGAPTAGLVGLGGLYASRRRR